MYLIKHLVTWHTSFFALPRSPLPTSPLPSLHWVMQSLEHIEHIEHIELTYAIDHWMTLLNPGVCHNTGVLMPDTRDRRAHADT